MKITVKLTQTFFSMLAAFLAVLAFSPGAYAHTGEYLYKARGYSEEEIRLTEIILDAVREHRTDRIDISGFNMDFRHFEDIYTTALLNEPEIFYVSVIEATLAYVSEDHILEFSPYYTCTRKDEEERRALIDAVSYDILSGVQDEWTDAEKALYIHDSLAALITYYNGSDERFGRSIYDAFVNRSSVCVGYALGFQYFMDKLDIPCICVTTDDHIWNMVRIDGQWYHVDVTWDDSAQATENFVMHNMLLLSDRAVISTEPAHEKPGYGYTASSSEYRKMFWKNSCSKISYLDGYWYYTIPEGVCRYSFDSGKTELVMKSRSVWKYSENMNWKISFSQTAVYGKNVYFNSDSVIYRYDPESDVIYKVYTPKMSEDEQIFDIYISDGKLVFVTGRGKDTCTGKRSFRIKAS